MDAALHSGSGTSLLRMFNYPPKALEAADRAGHLYSRSTLSRQNPRSNSIFADVAALAEGLQSAAIADKQQTGESSAEKKDGWINL